MKKDRSRVFRLGLAALIVFAIVVTIPTLKGMPVQAKLRMAWATFEYSTKDE